MRETSLNSTVPEDPMSCSVTTHALLPTSLQELLLTSLTIWIIVFELPARCQQKGTRYEETKSSGRLFPSHPGSRPNLARIKTAHGIQDHLKVYRTNLLAIHRHRG